MGYKNVSVMDCGYFYCPYLDLDGRVVEEGEELEAEIGRYESVVDGPEVEVDWPREGF